MQVASGVELFVYSRYSLKRSVELPLFIQYVPHSKMIKSMVGGNLGSGDPKIDVAKVPSVGGFKIPRSVYTCTRSKRKSAVFRVFL